MLDFTSALYLGLDHPSPSLEGWARLTSGKPAALEEAKGTLRVERELEDLTGLDRVVLGASTLHLFTDLFAMLARDRVAIWIDEASYPIARWGADRAVAAGRSVCQFPHHDAEALRNRLEGRPRGERPVVVTDGYSPMRGTLAPLDEYVRCAAERGGLVVVDDTQALGILGRRSQLVYGAGGGGSVRYFNLHSPGIVVVSSLAKAFGAPVAMLGGSRDFIEWFRGRSGTVVHCSPPSAASVAAALRALRINRRYGDALRERLAARVMQFRRALRDVVATNSRFPVQAIHMPGGIDARDLFPALARDGIRAVLHRDTGGAARISFVLRACHRKSDVDRAARSVLRALARIAGASRIRST